MPVLQQSQFAVRGGGGLPAVGCLYYSRANLPRRYLLDACTTAEPIKSDELQLGAMAALASLVVLGFRCWVLDACTTAEPVKSEELQLGAMVALVFQV